MNVEIRVRYPPNIYNSTTPSYRSEEDDRVKNRIADHKIQSYAQCISTVFVEQSSVKLDCC